MKISIEYENSTSEVLPIVKQADFAGAYCVSLTFSDGIQKKVNFGNFLKKSTHPAIRSYLDEKKFRAFTIENGNIVWGKNLDLIFPIEQLYEGEIL